MSRLSELLRQVEGRDPRLAADLKREFDALSKRRAFGLNFERHVPETVELPGRPIRRGDKVRFLPERGKTPGDVDRRLWRVKTIRRTGDGKLAELARQDDPDCELETATRAVDDLVVVAEFRDPIYPGLASTGKIERRGDKPFHTVINAENFHALQALLYTHEGKVDAIYIDPPYNTGARDWKYNNDYVDSDDAYRHSKWLAMMERRLKLAKRLLAHDGTLVVTVDEHEVHRFGILLGQIFEGWTCQTVTIVINPKGVTQRYLSRVEEYAMFAFSPGASITHGADDLLTHRKADVGSDDGVRRPRWKGLLRSGDEAARADRERMFYPVWIDPRSARLVRAGGWLPLSEEPDFGLKDGDLLAAWPVRKDMSLGRWGVGADTLNTLIAKGLAKAGTFDRRRRTWGISYVSEQGQADLESGVLKIVGRDPDTGVADVVYATSVTQRAKTTWHRSSHDAGAHGTDLVAALLGGRGFPKPKSLYAVEDTIRFLVADKPHAVVLDFFTGSGTTAHAVMRLNKQDSGRRQCISVTNNEVSADEQKGLRAQALRPGDPEWEALGICEYITKPRITAAVTGKTPEGEPIKGNYKFTDEFPMAEGFQENVEFFKLTYEAPRPVAHHRSFDAIAPLLWLKAGARGRRIEKATDDFDIADTYGILFDLDQSHDFIEAINKTDSVRMAFVVTDDDRAYQTICNELPAHVEPVRLYESYLTSFTINTGKE